MERDLLPFYFPTTVSLVDDSPNFLKHFSLLLNNDLVLNTFTSPRSALASINTQSSIINSLDNISNTTFFDETDERVYLELNSLHKQIYAQNRFAFTSVVIIDYFMPEMNGLEFALRIKHPEIKRILLTGKADEKIAVDAFNNGLIDRFFQKSSVDVEKQINQAIPELQKQYFREISGPISLILTNKSDYFLNNRQFGLFFSKLLTENKYVEYYIWGNPSGILLIDASGNTSFLFVLSQNIMNTHFEIASATGAPAALLKKLRSRQHIAWFPTDDGFYTGECSDWQNNVYDAEFLFGYNDIHLCSLVTPAPIKNIDLSRIQPYRAYQEQLDSVQQCS